VRSLITHRIDAQREENRQLGAALKDLRRETADADALHDLIADYLSRSQIAKVMREESSPAAEAFAELSRLPRDIVLTRAQANGMQLVASGVARSEADARRMVEQLGAMRFIANPPDRADRSGAGRSFRRRSPGIPARGRLAALGMLRLVLSCVLALAAGSAASYVLLVRSPLEHLEQAQEDHLALQRQYIDRLKLRPNLPLLRAQVPAMKDLDKAAKIVLPDFDGMGAGPRDIEAAIRAIAMEKQLTSRLEFSTGDWASKEFYYFRPFSIRVNGEFRQIVEFLQLVTTGSLELRMVKTASLQPVGERGQVTLTLDGLAFRYREEEAAAAERKANTRATAKPQ
jgi:Tfp pilus assembly protein PilO